MVKMIRLILLIQREVIP